MKLFKGLLNISEKKSFRLLIFWVVLLSILYSLLAILRHNHFQSGAFDLGIFDQAVWQYANFEFPYNTIKERFILGDHLTLTLPLLAPLFWFWDDVRGLLVFQAVFIAVSVFAIYKIALLRSLSPFISASIAFVYSFFYGIQTAVSFDFHPIVIAVGLLAWSAYFFESKKWILFWPTLILLLLTQENAGIGLAGLGFVYIFNKEHRRAAIIFIFGGIGVSLAATKIIELLSPVGYQYTPNLPSNPADYILGYFNAQEKIQNWQYSLVPLVFLPLFSPGAVAAVLLDLSQYYLMGFDRMWTPYQHHRAILAVFFILGLIEVIVFIRNRKILNVNYIILLVLLSTILSQYFFHFPLNKLAKTDYWKNEQWMEDNNELFTLIPKSAGVAASQNLVPHLSHRNEIYLIWPRYHVVEDACLEACWWLDFSGQPEYLIVDLHPGQWVTQLLESNENFSEAVSNMERSGKIKLEGKVGEARLYRINY